MSRTRMSVLTTRSFFFMRRGWDGEFLSLMIVDMETMSFFGSIVRGLGED